MTDEELAAAREAVDFPREAGKAIEVRLCADILLFYGDSLKDNKEGVIHFFEVAMGEMRPAMAKVVIDGQGQPKPVTPKTFELFQQWTARLSRRRNEYGLLLTPDEPNGNMPDTAFDMYESYGDPGYVRMILPVERLTRDPEGFLALAQRAAGPVKFIGGTAGFAVNVELEFWASQPNSQIAKLSRRFLGIDLGFPHRFADLLPERLKTVSWLTFVGKPLLESLPSKDELAKKLGPSCPIAQLEHGIMIRAGKEPKVGDVNRREAVDDYRKVAAALEPALLKYSDTNEYDGIGAEENTEAWLGRFSGGG